MSETDHMIHISLDEIYNLALHQLKLKANRLARKSSKSARNELDVINSQRKDIARELYHKFGISKDELYLNER
tara:strand:+ start:588 stop:806 length:219 start_codon:yes stop_codon:yes gene_type:complete